MSVNIAKPVAAPVVKKKTPKKEQQARVAPTFTVSVEHKSIRFALDVTNPTKKDVELTFPDGQTHDFVVLDSVGREVYRWGAGRMFTQSVQNRTIDGGETMHITEAPAGSAAGELRRRRDAAQHQLPRAGARAVRVH